MTCIIGVVDQGNVYIGGDSCASDDNTSRPVRSPKIFTLESASGDTMLIGYCESFRMGQILAHDIILPLHPKKQSNIQYLHRSVLPNIRTALRDGGQLTIENNVESSGEFLIGYRGQLFLFQDDLSILEPTDQMTSIGCGTECALGAMEAAIHLPAEERILLALTITAKHVPRVMPPFIIQHI